MKPKKIDNIEEELLKVTEKNSFSYKGYHLVPVIRRQERYHTTNPRTTYESHVNYVLNGPDINQYFTSNQLKIIVKFFKMLECSENFDDLLKDQK